MGGGQKFVQPGPDTRICMPLPQLSAGLSVAHTPLILPPPTPAAGKIHSLRHVHDLLGFMSTVTGPFSSVCFGCGLVTAAFLAPSFVGRIQARIRLWAWCD